MTIMTRNLLVMMVMKVMAVTIEIMMTMPLMTTTIATIRVIMTKLKTAIILMVCGEHTWCQVVLSV